MNNWKNTIEACIRGDARAERKVFDHYGERCFHYALRYLEQTAEAQDVVGQAFIKAFRGMGKAEFINLAGFEGWLLRIVANEALQLLRKNKRKTLPKEDLMMAGKVAMGSNNPENLLTEELHQQIDALPRGYRRVLRLFAVNGFSHAEIGKTLNISEGTSRSQLSKARKMLRKQLNENGYEE